MDLGNTRTWFQCPRRIGSCRCQTCWWWCWQRLCRSRTWWSPWTSHLEGKKDFLLCHVHESRRWHGWLPLNLSSHFLSTSFWTFLIASPTFMRLATAALKHRRHSSRRSSGRSDSTSANTFGKHCNVYITNISSKSLGKSVEIPQFSCNHWRPATLSVVRWHDRPQSVKSAWLDSPSYAACWLFVDTESAIR